jgi:hypothetical protein
VEEREEEEEEEARKEWYQYVRDSWMFDEP